MSINSLKSAVKGRYLACFVLVLVIIGCGNQPPKENTPSPTKKEEGWSATQVKTATELIANVSEEALQKVNAKAVYASQCISCHGPNGKMEIGGSKKLTESKLDLTNIVAQVYHGKGLMTPYHKILSNEEIVAISKYVQNMQGK